MEKKQCNGPSNVTDVSSDNEEWTTVISKRKIKQQVKDTKKKLYEKRKTVRDIRYLLTHVDFQKYRLKKSDIDALLKKSSEFGSVHVIGQGKCVGHLIDFNANQVTKRCLQCNWSDNDFNMIHCCCSPDVTSALSANFYFGCNGTIEEYLRNMKDI